MKSARPDPEDSAPQTGPRAQPTPRRQSTGSAAHLRSIVETAHDAIVSVDRHGTVVFWNRAATALFGHSAAEMVGQPLDAIMPLRHRAAHHAGMNRVLEGGQSRVIGQTVELTGLRKDRSEFPLDLSLARWESHGETYFTAILRDITARKDAEEALRRSEEKYHRLYEQMREMAERDRLTGLFNRRRIHELLANEIERGKRGAHIFSVMMLDVDDLKPVNDLHGHPAGDRLLRHVATVLRQSLRAVDSVGRYGGDEFLAILPFTNADQAQTAARTVASRLERRPLVLDDGTVTPVRLSMGLATFPLDSSVAQELIALADRNMYEAKRSARRVFSSTPQGVREYYANDQPTLDVLKGLAGVVSKRDAYAAGHLDRVAELAVWLGRKGGLPAREIGALQVASLVHDIGKIGIPERILRKPGRLAAEELAIVREHPQLSVLLLGRSLERDESTVAAILHHHERYDGRGYPHGLRGEATPPSARILTLADAYCAMVVDRPYRPALSPAQAVASLERSAGTQFDPALVATFVKHFAEIPLHPSRGPATT